MSDGNRTVTQLLASSFCSPKGEMLSVFVILCFSCLVRRLLVFGCSCWSCVVWLASAYVLVLCFGGSLPKVFGKILLMSGLLFFGFGFSSFGFFVDVVFCFFEEVQFR